MRTVTLGVGECVRIGEYRVFVAAVVAGEAELGIEVPTGTEVRGLSVGEILDPDPV